MTEPSQQPWLHDLVLVLSAPTQVWSGADGQVRADGVQGLLHGDRRALSELVLRVDGREPAPVAAYDDGGDAHVFLSVPRSLGDPGLDPTVRVTRRREVAPGRLREKVTVSSTAADAVRCAVELRVAGDLARLDAVKYGAPTATVAPTAVDGSRATWSADGLDARVTAAGARVERDGDAVTLTWQLEVAPGGAESVDVEVEVSDSGAVFAAPATAAAWADPVVESVDRRIGPVLERCLADLRLLRLAPNDDPDEEFIGAGAPWFLTLFGRDSLWAARMLMPVSTGLAASTLRVLARHQGTAVDAGSEEQPGKILHEVRSGSFSLGELDGVEHVLPPVYYGTIDATPLWALTLHDAWRWGLPEDQVERLVPALERALAWLPEHGDADGDHLLEYLDVSGRGLSNQGWKDSEDAVRRADGSLAHGPVALSEVQGYAYAAAVRGADLLEAFGVGGTDRWRAWADELRAEFRRRFWVEDAAGAFPAIALDGDKRPVASLTSNIGHLLGTGLLDDAEVDAVARRLAAPDMLSGFGIRTLSSDAAGYSPTGYHVGSVWPHDTAVCLAGLAAEGRPEVAPVGEALLATLHAFDGRPPELLAGDARSDHPVPVPYPASCRPQAWAAASAVSLVTAMTGLAVDVPKGEAAIAPVQPWTWGRTRISGLRTGSRELTLEIDESGEGDLRH